MRVTLFCYKPSLLCYGNCSCKIRQNTSKHKNNLIYIIKQQGLYHDQNKVTLSLASIHNCKMACYSHANKAYVAVVVNDKQCYQRSNCSQSLFINERCQAMTTASSTLSFSRAHLPSSKNTYSPNYAKCSTEFYLHETEKSFPHCKGRELNLVLIQRPRELGNGLSVDKREAREARNQDDGNQHKVMVIKQKVIAPGDWGRGELWLEADCRPWLENNYLFVAHRKKIRY